MSQVVLGKLQQTNTLDVEGESSPQFLSLWDARAKWAYIRFKLKERQADGEIMRDGLDVVFTRVLADAGSSTERTLQYILDESLNVKAVATPRHLLTLPSEIYAIANKLVIEMFGAVTVGSYPDVWGMSFTTHEIGNFRLGLQVYSGNIITRNAIHIASMMRVLSCFNPISWLRISEAARFTGLHRTVFERVLRIQTKSEIEPRMREAFKLAKARGTQIEQALMHSKTVSISEREARIVLSALGLSFSLGAATVNQVHDRFLLEDKTMYGVSMAASYVANHGTLRVVRGTAAARQSLSTIAGAAILMENVQDVVDKSVEWLKQRIVHGELKTVEAVLQGVALP
jgi:hypothetical protein